MRILKMHLKLSQFVAECGFLTPPERLTKDKEKVTCKLCRGIV